jgi:hypothetical protein
MKHRTIKSAEVAIRRSILKKVRDTEMTMIMRKEGFRERGQNVGRHTKKVNPSGVSGLRGDMSKPE